MAWSIQLVGDAFDLAALAQSLTNKDVNVACEREEYVLTSDRFLPTDDYATIRQIAENLLELINGALNVLLGTRKPIRLGALYEDRDDGTRGVSLEARGGTIHIQGYSRTYSVTQADGTIKESHSTDRIAQLVPIAGGEDSVIKVLRYFATGKLDWHTLYNIFEVVEDNSGMKYIASKKWATTKSMRLLKQTANHYDAIGLAARHSVSKQPPPCDPMSISDARRLIRKIVSNWLGEKSESP